MSSSHDQSSAKIFDRALVAGRLLKRKDQKADFVSNLVCEDLKERLALISRKFNRAAIIGPIPHNLPKSGISADGTFAFERFSTLLPFGDKAPLDPERLELPQKNYDLIVSLLDLQFVDDAPGYLAKIRSRLAPDGLMLLGAIAGSSFIELRTAWLEAESSIYGGAFARIAPFIDVKDAGSLMQSARFALPVTDIEHYDIRYASPLALMQEIKISGAANPLFDRPQRPVTRSLLAAVCDAYIAAARDPDKRVRATLEILWMSGWAPHESQQKPLAPGSAKVSLAKILSSQNI